MPAPTITEVWNPDDFAELLAAAQEHETEAGE
jgi:hypothetical protein